MKIAIVGGGITGVTAALLLSHFAKVVVYEKEAEIGGNYGGLEIHQGEDKQLISLEKGNQMFFPYYHKRTAALFEYLGIYTEPCARSYTSVGSMPFDLTGLPCHGISLGRMFGNGKVKKGIKEFYESWENNYRNRNIPINLSLRQYISGLNIDSRVVADAIYPMVALLWNYPIQDIAELSANKFMHFINESKLLDARVKDSIRYIPEGVDRYIRKAIFNGKFECLLGKKVESIKINESGVNIFDEQRGRRSFDIAIITCGKDQALNILDPAINNWRTLISKLEDVEMPLFIHQDESILSSVSPSSYISAATTYTPNAQQTSYHYDLSGLFKLPTQLRTIMSINCEEAPKNIIYQGKISRPDLGTVTQRYYRDIDVLQGKAGIYYFNHKLDYDTSPMTEGINIAVKLAELLGAEIPFSYKG